jgi:hypothetical protein
LTASCSAATASSSHKAVGQLVHGHV